jgi:hypothetical protein
VFQGRFKSVLILEESRLDEVGRYLHLNPVRIAGLGLSKEDQKRARVLGCDDPGRELVSRRLATLDGYPWSSWQVYSGSDPAVPWLLCERLLSGCGGRSLAQQRRALRAFTEAPIRQGVVESPWERLVGGVILGKEEESLRVLKEVGGDRREQTAARRGKAAARPEWEAMVKATEGILGKEWSEMILRHGDWGRDGLLAVATRHLGWRLGEVVEREPGVSYAAAAQGIRRFWKRAPNSPEMQAFVTTLLDQLSNGHPIAPWLGNSNCRQWVFLIVVIHTEAEVDLSLLAGLDLDAPDAVGFGGLEGTDEAFDGLVGALEGVLGAQVLEDALGGEAGFNPAADPWRMGLAERKWPGRAGGRGGTL